MTGKTKKTESETTVYKTQHISLVIYVTMLWYSN